MGIDIGVLDVCVLVGYPGAITTTWQRGGRVGREDRESLIALVAGQDALDQYFMKHPEVFFKSEFESAVVDPDNMPILKSHIQCVAAEMPLFKGDKWFSGDTVSEAISELEKEGKLLRSVDEDVWHSVTRYPQRYVNIRGIGESNTIFEEPRTPLPPGKKPRVIGSIDGNRVYSEGHPGAIYLHRAKQYQIIKLDLARKNMLARPVNVNYYTMPMREKETEILSTKKSKPVQNFVVRLGELKVTETITGYEKKRISGGERISVHSLELPPYSFETVGLWIEMDDFIPKAVNAKMLNFMGGIHAIEHAAIALFPLFALCERNDVGGISIPLHPQVGKAAVFIYDGYPGGVGLSEQSYLKIEALLEKTLSLIENCDCEKGCPSCIHSPKCGNGNVPLDKESAAMILKMLLDKPEAKEWIELGASGEMPDEEIVVPKKDEPEPKSDGPRIMVMDIETKRSAQEVGGWNKAHLMRVAVAVVWDSKDDKMYAYKEDEVDDMLKHMAKADLVVGFNIIGFDYKVLSAYDDGTVENLPTFDILYDVKDRLGHRLSLDHLASHTLGSKKTADGLQSLKWVKQGRLDLVEEYCIKDVEITRNLLYHGIEKKYLRFERKNAGVMELAIDWEIDDLVEKAKKS
jgi:DEAD/DEAH box helicase domain-containing protein